ncbi:hypothetical protein [Thermaerobacillus caldiproteolyticus]|uniref:Uncharacterized protein n=1 Tax=Thermaerobacillus caldiproteolyticus TaxID=247480 RepID=A0A7V9Z490_9BACL|nr:hypothetical protein [Anoxybacillus caldiproteolyticus]MBA2873725.1 hypothetical protein [Anoxybacillus caldiproteolyticus]
MGKQRQRKRQIASEQKEGKSAETEEKEAEEDHYGTYSNKQLWN